jgi:hypothetical protein
MKWIQLQYFGIAFATYFLNNLKMTLENKLDSKFAIKQRNLFLGILFDLIGMITCIFPFLGEFCDIIWAPLSAVIISQMYKGVVGKVSGFISFAEEIVPFTDFIPTFTLTWIYNYVIKKQ